MCRDLVLPVSVMAELIVGKHHLLVELSSFLVNAVYVGHKFRSSEENWVEDGGGEEFRREMIWHIIWNWHQSCTGVTSK